MGFKRRYKQTTDNVWHIAATCVVFFLVGNLLMFQSYHSFVDETRSSAIDHRRLDQSLEKPLVLELTDDLLTRSIGVNNQYNVFESRLRKLMEDTRDSSVESFQSSKIPLTKGHRDEISNMLNCEDISNITDRKYIASGWTKAVFKGVYKGIPVAVKTVDMNGQDISTCVQTGSSMDVCYKKAAQKIVKEIVLLQAIPHENVIKVLGFCVPRQQYNGDSNSAVVMVTELGETIDLIKLLQLSWEDRLRISNDLTHLLQFMSSTPFGSMAMNDFRRQQFVLVDGQLKLSDVDDAGFDEPACTIDKDCDLVFSSSNFTKRMPCIRERCFGFNEYRNMFNSGRHFTTFLLPHGAPPALKPMISKVVEAYEQLSLSSRQLVEHMENIVSLYSQGKHLNRSSEATRILGYKRYKHSDLPGQFDYRCRFSISGGGCTLSVYDVREAEDICNMDPECTGFVLTNEKTWTGRKVVHLKNGVGIPSENIHTDLYLRPS